MAQDEKHDNKLHLMHCCEVSIHKTILGCTNINNPVEVRWSRFLDLLNSITIIQHRQGSQFPFWMYEQVIRITANMMFKHISCIQF